MLWCVRTVSIHAVRPWVSTWPTIASPPDLIDGELSGPPRHAEEKMLCKVFTAAETAGDLRISALLGSADNDATSPHNFVSNSRPSIGRCKISVAPSA